MQSHYLLLIKRASGTLALSLVFGLILSACGPAQTTGTGLAQASTPANTEEFVLIWKLYGTPTATPYRAPYTPMAQTAAPTRTLSAQSVAAQLEGPAAKGKTIFTGVGSCFTCHDTTNGIKIVGPSLKGVASRAVSREPGKSADVYLHESIMTPNAYLVEGFPQGIMPQNFAQILSKDQIDDLVAYLKTLN
jgi:cytochrome c2